MGTPAQKTPMRLIASESGTTAAAEPVPVAILARTSTRTVQDPYASLSRQVRACQEWIPAGWYIAGYYWDIESGSIDLEDRSQGEDYQQLDRKSVV